MTIQYHPRSKALLCPASPSYRATDFSLGLLACSGVPLVARSPPELFPLRGCVERGRGGQVQGQAGVPSHVPGLSVPG